MCYELVLFFASFHEMVLFCVTEAILQDCLIFSIHVTHVITLHTCRSSFGFYIWQINLKNIPVVFVSNFAGFQFMNIPESKMHL